MLTTQLDYNIVPDKSPLYTTVDQLNQSTCALQVTATNAHSAPVKLTVIEIELKKVDQGVDTVQLLLPGSEGAIGCPPSLTGPGGSNWSITNDDGKLTLKPSPDGSTVTFQPKDNLSFTLQNVVIREGGTGSAFVPVLEESDSGRGETQVGIGITQSTLAVQLSSDSHMVEPGGSAMLTWTTTDATSGTLVLPGNSPNSMTIPSINLVHGQQQVWPIGDTTYSLTCQGLGPNVTAEVPVNVDSLQMGDLEASVEVVLSIGGQLLLRWNTNADSCTLDDGSGAPPLIVPTVVPNATYENGYPVNPDRPTTYTLHGTKRLGNGEYVDDTRSKSVQVFGIADFGSPATAFDASQAITFSWLTFGANSCELTVSEGSGLVSVPVSNSQTASCQVSATPDGQTLIVSKADGSNQELGRITLPTPCPTSATFVLYASGPAVDYRTCIVELTRPQINQFTKNVASRTFRPRSTEGFMETLYWLEVAWNVSKAGSVQVIINGSQYSNAGTGSWSGSESDSNPPPDTASITCTGFGGPISQS